MLASIARIAAAVIGMCLLLSFAAGIYLSQPSFRRTANRSVERADPGKLKDCVKALSAIDPPRSVDEISGLDKASDYIIDRFRQYSSSVEIQPYTARNAEFRNIIARFGNTTGEKIIIGAHYDVCDRRPGADDNASGVAGLIELARLLSLDPPAVPVDLVAYSTEEPPYFGSDFMGSFIHSSGLKKIGEKIRGVIILEMIGYFSGVQESPSPVLKLIYPSRGDFILLVGMKKERRMLSDIKAAVKGAEGVSVYSFCSPIDTGVDDSDHRNYWKHGFDAVMITDTAYHRNPNYHTEKDTYDTLDYEKMAKIVDGVFIYIKNN